MPRPTTLAVLRHGAFARYLGGEAISMVGSWMQMFAQGWVIINLPGLHADALTLGALQFFSGLPMLLLALAGGSLADRMDKRLIMNASLLVQLLTAVAIGWLIGRGDIQVWHLFVAGAVLGTAAAFEVPAVSAFVPELVPREDMSAAIALDRVTFHATRLIGPALGGYLVGRFGAPTAYYLNAASYLALSAALFSIPRRPPATAEEQEKREGSIWAGLEYVRRDGPTRAMVLLIAAMTIFVSPFLMILMPIYSGRLLGLGPQSMGSLMAVSGIGSLTGAFGLLSIPRGFRALALKLGCGAAVLALFGMAAAHSFAWAAGSVVLLTLGLSTCFGLSNIVVQERAVDEIRGRISAVCGLAFFGIIPFSGLLIAWCADWLGLRQTLCGCAVAYGLTTALLLFGRRELASAPPETAVAVVS